MAEEQKKYFSVLNSGGVDYYAKDVEVRQSLTNYVQKSNTAGLLKNDGTVDTNTYVTVSTAPVTSVNGSTGAEVIDTMAGSGDGHKGGLVPDPGDTAGTDKYLREDGTWAVPAGGGGGDTNVIESISVNGTAQTVTDKNVDITVPTTTSQLTNDSGFLTSAGISGKEDKLTVSVKSSGTSLSAAKGYLYRYSNNVGTLAITLPAVTSGEVANIIFCFATGTSPNVTFTSTSTIYKLSGFSIAASSRYEINAMSNGSYWSVTLIKIS